MNTTYRRLLFAVIVVSLVFLVTVDSAPKQTDHRVLLVIGFYVLGIANGVMLALYIQSDCSEGFKHE